MKRIFLTKALSLTALSAMAVLLVAYAQESTGSKHRTTQSDALPISADKPSVTNIESSVDELSARTALRPPTQYAIDHDPRKPGFAMFKEASELFRAGDLKAAERKCREAIRFFQPTNLPELPYGLLGDIQMAKGQYKEALQSYLIMQPYSANPVTNLDIAVCYIKLGDVENARKWYSDRYILRFSNISKEQLPGTDTPHALEASILLARGDEAFLTANSKTAEAYYASALELAPHNGLLIDAQARTLMDLKRYDEAFPMWTRLLHYGNAKQIERATSTLFQYWPRAKVEAALREAGKLP